MVFAQEVDLEFGEYLDDDFDSRKLTCALLRNILLRYGFEMKGCEKRDELLSMFENKVKPNARDYQETLRNSRRSSKGIENIGS